MSHFLIKLSMSAAQLPTRHLIVFATSNIRSTAGRFAVLLKLVIQATTTRWRSITRLQFSLRIQKYLSLTVADNGGDSIGVIHDWFDCVCVSKNTNISQLNGADHHMITHLRLYITQPNTCTVKLTFVFQSNELVGLLLLAIASRWRSCYRNDPISPDNTVLCHLISQL